MESSNGLVNKHLMKNGNLKIEVIKGLVDQTSEKAKYQIDGLSGSTLTTRGVSNLVQILVRRRRI